MFKFRTSAFLLAGAGLVGAIAPIKFVAPIASEEYIIAGLTKKDVAPSRSQEGVIPPKALDRPQQWTGLHQA